MLFKVRLVLMITPFDYLNGTSRIRIDQSYEFCSALQLWISGRGVHNVVAQNPQMDSKQAHANFIACPYYALNPVKEVYSHMCRQFEREFFDERNFFDGRFINRRFIEDRIFERRFFENHFIDGRRFFDGRFFDC